MANRKIVIVDDEPLLVEILSEHFLAAGWEVAGATNGHEALKKIVEFQPTVLLSDINMPGLDGLELLETLYKQESQLPVILLSGYRDLQKMQRAWASCCYDFLDKPVDVDHVLSIAQTAHENGPEYIKFARKRFSLSHKSAS